ncbi:MAG: SMC-Scp complex subunit ScpB [Gammaproteobacteria bacterium]|nr:SMC-Scp complex subunit ScpB [Gammaproteobacteria bacterium]MDH5652126.1 SMC-Scp complex subunit ScpB [Gammaproteobacteria bacterium]
MEKQQLKPILEAVIMASSTPLSIDALMKIFPENEPPEKDELQAALDELVAECEGRSYELKQVSSGYRFQVRKDYAEYVTRLWEDKPARYSRALLETLALIAYRQPITRGEIEAVRGVSVSSQIIKTLHERDWIKVVGHRDVPGKPSLYATTKEFLDYFNLAGLDDLPSLQEIRDIDQINAELDLRLPDAMNEEMEEGGEKSAESEHTEDAATETVAAEVVDEQDAAEVAADTDAGETDIQAGFATEADDTDTEADDDDATVINLATEADDAVDVVEVTGQQDDAEEEGEDNTFRSAPAGAEH